jgi:hypothetical protein
MWRMTWQRVSVRLYMLECDACLGGWHLNCLTPPLTEVGIDG